MRCASLKKFVLRDYLQADSQKIAGQIGVGSSRDWERLWRCPGGEHGKRRQ